MYNIRSCFYDTLLDCITEHVTYCDRCHV